MEKELVKTLKEILSSSYDNVVDASSWPYQINYVSDVAKIAESGFVYFIVCKMPWHKSTERTLHVCTLSSHGFSGACVSWLLEDLPCSSLMSIDCKGEIMDMCFHVDFK